MGEETRGGDTIGLLLRRYQFTYEKENVGNGYGNAHDVD